MKVFILSLFSVNFVNALNSLSNDCGLRSVSSIGSAIVGRHIAIRGEFPWIVALQEIRNGNEYEHLCSATVISDRWIVTAAHCLQRKNLTKIRGVIGTNDLERVDKKSFITDFEKVVIHEDYEPTTFRNDIALLKTTKSIPIYSRNRNINQICLPNKNQRFNRVVITSDWGVVNGERNLLFTGVLRLTTQENCRKLYKEAFSARVMLCADLFRGKNACEIDSGAPLQKLIEGRVYLVGIVSFGKQCANRFKGPIYTKVSHFTNWINKRIGTFSVEKEHVKDVYVPSK